MIASCDRDPMCRRNANAVRSADFSRIGETLLWDQIKMRPASRANTETEDDLAMLPSVDMEKLFDA